jgi:hypothetical protein
MQQSSIYSRRSFVGRVCRTIRIYIFNSDKAASRLLQSLTVQNPDFILLKFLKSGARVREDELRQPIVNPVNFNAALVLLEVFACSVVEVN